MARTGAFRKTSEGCIFRALTEGSLSVAASPSNVVPALEQHPHDAFAAATYAAFISYSHAKDKTLASAMQSAIQRLGKPWYRRRALRLFRDDTSLTAICGRL
jgi:hypothetical protein